MSKIFVSIVLIFLFCCSCKKETGVEGAAGPAGNAGVDGSLLDTGTISGNLAVYDEFSSPMKDSSGVTVSLDQYGTQKTTTSDASGNYSFHGLPAGTYDLTYQKTNFGTMKVFGVSHSPGSNLNTSVPEVYILQNPVKTAVDSIQIVPGYFYDIVYIYLDTSSLSYTPYQYNFVVLIGNNPNPNPSNTTPSPLFYYVTADGLGAYTLIIDKSNLQASTQTTGPYYLTVGTYNRWVRKYNDPSSFFDTGYGGYYVDPSNGKYVYPNLKLSPNKVMIQ
jgi:hypothetical protein